VLYIDLDDFKQINDVHGHRTGDLVLAEVTSRLQQAVRSKDLVARVGGDEFVVICVDLPNEVVALDLAHRMVAAVNRPFDAEGVAVAIAASVGLAVAHPGTDVIDLIEPADRALRDAKQAGKHCLVSYPG
jgi:diguanylate cyclase (GGDEF)-like protein